MGGGFGRRGWEVVLVDVGDGDVLAMVGVIQ